VYRLERRGTTYCEIQSASQLRGPSGGAIPLDVPRGEGLLDGRSSTGLCPWPDGVYRRDGDTVSYLRRGSTYCAVVNDAQSELFGFARPWQVAAEPLGDPRTFAEGRSFSGDCLWPDGVYDEPADDGWTKLYGGDKHCYYEFNQGRLIDRSQVKYVPAGSRLRTGRTDTGFCAPEQRCLRLPDEEACSGKCGRVKDRCGYWHDCEECPCRPGTIPCSDGGCRPRCD
jgi:hypothetical protein